MDPINLEEFDSNLFDLFCIELQEHSMKLHENLIEIEKNPKDQKLLESLLRSAHSIKGAARIIHLTPIVELSHRMEDCFESFQKKNILISREKIDLLLTGVDFLISLSKIQSKDIQSWFSQQMPSFNALIRGLTFEKKVKKIKKLESEKSTALSIQLKSTASKIKRKSRFSSKSRILRIPSENLTRMMGLAGESLVESRRLNPFGENLKAFKNKLYEIENLFSLLKENIKEECINNKAKDCLMTMHRQLNALDAQVSQGLADLDSFAHRHTYLSDQLYQEVVHNRMQPFGEGLIAFPRLVRDLARDLNKEVHLEIIGESTLVDREILEKLESPLNHLIRNAIDHGIELPAERQAAGKPIIGSIKIQAQHRGRELEITVTDDGRGISMSDLKKTIVEKKLANSEVVSYLTNDEIINFLFLPGFSTSSELTEVSGRGVGLDVVNNVVKELGGTLRVQNTPGKGMSFLLQLPLSLSVLRALIVLIGNEPYAFPLARIERLVFLSSEEIINKDHGDVFDFYGTEVALFSSWEILDLSKPQNIGTELSVIVLSDQSKSYGIVVDRFIGEKDLVVHEPSVQLGKVKDIKTAALMEDGSPVLIIDTSDLIRSIDAMILGRNLKEH